MPQYEYKVVPAPTKGTKVKGVKSPEARFALSLQAVMNELAHEGWSYLRAETLPSTERSGLTGSTTNWRNLLVFSRAINTAEFAIEEEMENAPEDIEITPKSLSDTLAPITIVDAANDDADQEDAADETEQEEAKNKVLSGD